MFCLHSPALHLDNAMKKDLIVLTDSILTSQQYDSSMKEAEAVPSCISKKFYLTR